MYKKLLYSITTYLLTMQLCAMEPGTDSAKELIIAAKDGEAAKVQELIAIYDVLIANMGKENGGK